VRISVIIPALNESAIIEQACQRALALAQHEVIVVDGGSTDPTPRIAADVGCRVLTSQPGRAVQQNVGARSATGEVFLFLHADTWLEPPAMRQIEECLHDARVVGCAFRQRIAAPGWIYRLLEQGNAWRVRLRSLPYGDQGIVVRREIFERIGGFPEIPLLEDIRCMRCVRRCGRVALLPGPLHVGARRWQRHGVVWQTLRNWSILAGEQCGASPERLARHYRRHDL
jgi:rSAM/selenodomain-associated transferase 2